MYYRHPIKLIKIDTFTSLSFNLSNQKYAYKNITLVFLRAYDLMPRKLIFQNCI